MSEDIVVSEDENEPTSDTTPTLNATLAALLALSNRMDNHKSRLHLRFGAPMSQMLPPPLIRGPTPVVDEAWASEPHVAEALRELLLDHADEADLETTRHGFVTRPHAAP